MRIAICPNASLSSSSRCIGAEALAYEGQLAASKLAGLPLGKPPVRFPRLPPPGGRRLSRLRLFSEVSESSLKPVQALARAHAFSCLDLVKCDGTSDQYAPLDG